MTPATQKATVDLTVKAVDVKSKGWGGAIQNENTRSQTLTGRVT